MSASFLSPAPAGAQAPEQPSPFIIGGQPVDTTAWPNVVSVQTTAGLCSGTLIDALWVLTAAHCIAPTATIGGGGTAIGALAWSLPATGYAHPAYSPQLGTNDVGLYRLGSPAPVPPERTYTPLAEIADIELLDAGLPAQIFGFGVNNQTTNTGGSLLMASASLIGQDECAADAVARFGFFDDIAEMCTLSPTMSACNGDSGGPVMVNVPGKGWIQLGIVSFGGTVCASYNFHAFVPQAVTWIRSTMAGGSPFLRLWGLDRYDTAGTLSAGLAQPGVTVYVATGENFPDSLAAGAVAARSNSPLLLVRKDEVPLFTDLLIGLITPPRIVVAGGPAVISDAVIAQLQAAAPGAVVERVAGADRYETARLLNATVTTPLTGKNLWIASGRAFADPLVASAAAAMYGEPFVLVEGSEAIRADVRAHIQAYAPTGITVVGDTSTVSQAALTDLATIAPVTVVAGADINERSVRVWDRLATVPTTVVVATSDNFPDALAAIPFATNTRSPLLLTKTACLAGPVADRIASWNALMVFVLGGPAALSTAIDTKTRC